MDAQKQYWQWVCNTYGPLGWFTDEQRREYEETEEFKDGHWREVPKEEMAEHLRWYARMYYEQS